MTITLKKLRVVDTEDGYAFECTVYWKGKKIGTAMNEGFGEPDTYDIEQTTINAINDYGKTLPPIALNDAAPDTPPIHHDISTLIGLAIAEFESRRVLKKLFKKYVLLVDPANNTVLRGRRISAKTGVDDTEGVIARAKLSHPSFVALNSLAETEALALARKANIV